MNDGRSPAAVLAAVSRHVLTTPLLAAPDDLSQKIGRPVWFKAECLQRTGSFKVRGAAARLEALTGAERAAGVVACSSGNHGRAVSYVAGRLGIPAVVYVPEWVDPVKLEGIRAGGAETVLAGETFDESEALAEERARVDDRVYVSAYDDPWVIAGQGTLADEIIRQLGVAPSCIVVPLSGGGLAGGIAARIGEHPDAEHATCVAVSAENASVMLASVRAGRPVELPEVETLANALAGGIGLGNRHSFDLVKTLVKHHATVTEPEIAAAMRYAIERSRLVVEGGGAVGLAALLSDGWEAAVPPAGPGAGDGPVVVVLSGGNVSTDVLERVLVA